VKEFEVLLNTEADRTVLYSTVLIICKPVLHKLIHIHTYT